MSTKYSGILQARLVVCLFFKENRWTHCETLWNWRFSFIFHFASGFVLQNEYLAQDKRWADQLFLSQSLGAVVKSVDIWAFQTTSANLYAFYCVRQPACIKGCKRPCQFRKDNSTKTPFLSVVMGIMLYAGVLPKPLGNLAMWCYWLHWYQVSTMETITLSVMCCETSENAYLVISFNKNVFTEALHTNCVW